MRVAAVILTVLLSVAGCSGDDDAPSNASEASGVERAAVRPATDSYDQALARGVLRADPRSGCLWLEGPDGAVGTQLLLYGASYRVDFSTKPASIFDGDRVVARVGESVEVAGGVSARDGVKGCPVEATSFLGYFDRA